jgi:integrase/recombinase XerC
VKNAPLAVVTFSGDTNAVIVPFVGADVVAHVREMRLRGLSENTVTLRMTVLGLLVRHAGRPLLNLDRDDLDSWQDAIACLAPETRLAYVSGARSYYRWACAEGLLTRDPSAVLIVPKVARGLPHPISESSLEWVLSHAPDPLRIWFELAACTGTRAAEIAALERPDVLDDCDKPGLLLHGKGSKERVVPLTPHPLRSLREYGMPWRGPLFRRPDGRQVSAHSVSERCNRWLHKHGYPNTLHDFRHRYATELYEASGHDLVLVAQMLGHASVKTTTVYTRVKARAGYDAARRIDHPLTEPWLRPLPERDTGT